MPRALTTKIGNQPALDNVSMRMCNWLGVISVVNPAKTTTMVP
jgi:hypothetical protein